MECKTIEHNLYMDGVIVDVIHYIVFCQKDLNCKKNYFNYIRAFVCTLYDLIAVIGILYE